MATTVTLAAVGANAEQLSHRPPTHIVYDTGTNAALSASRAAVAAQAGGAGQPGTPGLQHWLTHFTCSFSGALAAVTTLTVKDGTTVIWQTEIAVDVRVYTENFETRPLHNTPGAAMSVNVGAAGSGIVQTISAAFFSTQA